MIDDQLAKCAGIETKDDSGRSSGLTLEDVRESWNDYQTSGRGDAVHWYLYMVFGLVASWRRSPSKGQDALRVVQTENPKLRLPSDLYATVIMATSDPKKVDGKIRSKWSRVLRYAAEYKPPNELLPDFIKRTGGINKSAARYTRHLGRNAKRKKAGK